MTKQAKGGTILKEDRAQQKEMSGLSVMTDSATLWPQSAHCGSMPNADHRPIETGRSLPVVEEQIV